MTAAPTPRKGIPDATVARLPEYLHTLNSLADSGVHSVSSEELSTAVGVTSAKLRKDLSYLGSYGVRGVGYDVDHLAYQISHALGLSHDWPVVIVGLGNLGRALAAYGGFAERGVRVVGLFDRAEEVVGRVIAQTPVRPLDQLARVVEEHAVEIGIVATPDSGAQEAADALVAAGVGSILTFAAVALHAPADVRVRRVDLATEVQILAFHQARGGRTLQQAAT